jgi:hypothetical protein
MPKPLKQGLLLVLQIPVECLQFAKECKLLLQHFSRGWLLHQSLLSFYLYEQELQGLELNGWNGQNESNSSFYIYVINGLLLDGETKIEHTGIFNLIK